MKNSSRAMRVLPLLLTLSAALWGCGQESERAESASHLSANSKEVLPLAESNTPKEPQLAGVFADAPLAVLPGIPPAPIPGGSGPPLINVAIPGGGDGDLQIDRNRQSNRELLRDFQSQLFEEVDHLKKIDGRRLAAEKVRVVEKKYRNDPAALRQFLLQQLKQTPTKQSVQAKSTLDHKEHNHVH